MLFVRKSVNDDVRLRRETIRNARDVNVPRRDSVASDECEPRDLTRAVLLWVHIEHHARCQLDRLEPGSANLVGCHPNRMVEVLVVRSSVDTKCPWHAWIDAVHTNLGSGSLLKRRVRED